MKNKKSILSLALVLTLSTVTSHANTRQPPPSAEESAAETVTTGNWYDSILELFGL